MLPMVSLSPKQVVFLSFFRSIFVVALFFKNYYDTLLGAGGTKMNKTVKILGLVEFIKQSEGSTLMQLSHTCTIKTRGERCEGKRQGAKTIERRIGSKSTKLQSKKALQ